MSQDNTGAGICVSYDNLGVELLRKTFLAMLADDEAKAEAKKLGIDLEPVSGAEIHSLLESVYATPPAIIDQVRELSGRKK